MSSESTRGGLVPGLDITSARYALDEVLPFVGGPEREYHGYQVNMRSARYILFRDKGTTCASCRREGTFFMLRKASDPKAGPNRAHLNLWYEESDGTLVMLTKDHIVPRSAGGQDTQENYQPMCLTCNIRKGGVQRPMQIDKWKNLVRQYQEGTFRPSEWNWVVAENSVPVLDEASPNGWKYAPRVCIYVMGSGGQEILHDFILAGEINQQKRAQAVELIRQTFGVERVIFGLG